jgi:hypothetical protein
MPEEITVAELAVAVEASESLPQAEGRRARPVTLPYAEKVFEIAKPPVRPRTGWHPA